MNFFMYIERNMTRQLQIFLVNLFRASPDRSYILASLARVSLGWEKNSSVSSSEFIININRYRLRLRRVDTRKLTFNRMSLSLDDVAPTNSIDPTSPPVAIDTSQLSRPRRRQQAFLDRFVISLLMHHHSLKYSP